VATLSDVAARAGVDVSTVSRVLRADPRQAVRPETRLRILQAADELDYQPDVIARSLRTGRAMTVALVVPDLDNIGFTAVVRGVQRAAQEQGYAVLIAELRDGGDSRAVEDIAGRVDGLLVASAHTDEPWLARLATRLPVVLVNRRARGFPGAVIVDDEAGTALAVSHLVELGHRGIAHIAGDLATDTGQRRLDGFRTALRSHKLRARAEWNVSGDYTEAGGRRAVTELLAGKERPTAIFAANLVSGLGAIAGLREHGCEVPDDMSVVVMDEHPLAAVTVPPLTTVSMPLEEMGAAAMRMVIESLGGSAASELCVDTQPALIVRGSTKPVAKGS
jgi:DNA-binding LacI/PurR family transcriptional regulator